jgi:hypothetical protein
VEHQLGLDQREHDLGQHDVVQRLTQGETAQGRLAGVNRSPEEHEDRQRQDLDEDLHPEPGTIGHEQLRCEPDDRRVRTQVAEQRDAHGSPFRPRA